LASNLDLIPNLLPLSPPLPLALSPHHHRHLIIPSLPETKTASLYITHASQNLSLGSLCLTILENLAIEEYGAEWLTLDTTPYVIDDMSVEHEAGKVGGSGKEPGKERIGEESRNLGWYRRRGYEEFRVS
jgi:hypothetical protein